MGKAGWAACRSRWEKKGQESQSDLPEVAEEQGRDPSRIIGVIIIV